MSSLVFGHLSVQHKTELLLANNNASSKLCDYIVDLKESVFNPES